MSTASDRHPLHTGTACSGHTASTAGLHRDSHTAGQTWVAHWAAPLCCEAARRWVRESSQTARTLLQWAWGEGEGGLHSHHIGRKYLFNYWIKLRLSMDVFTHVQTTHTKHTHTHTKGHRHNQHTHTHGYTKHMCCYLHTTTMQQWNTTQQSLTQWKL